MLAKRGPALIYAFVLALTLAWVASATLPLSEVLRQVYARTCHQMADRSWWIGGRPMAVCARCFGIYAGYLIGLLVYPFSRPLASQDVPPRRWLVLALIPVTCDAVGGHLGLFETPLLSRSLTGLIAGVAIAFYTLPGIVSLGQQSR
jgi:uncharacterized membrane protein